MVRAHCCTSSFLHHLPVAMLLFGALTNANPVVDG
jgi:hypothetical protein